MTAINPNNLSKFTGILNVRTAGSADEYTRIASVRWLTVWLDISNVIEIKADDTGTVYKATWQITTVEAELLENMWRDTIDLLFNGTATDISGSSTPITGEALGTGWTVDTPIKLVNKNGDNTEVTSIVIDAAGTPLVLDTDYRVYVWTDWYTYIYPITAQAWILDADYSYLPNASEKFVTLNDTQELKNLEVQIIATSWIYTRITTISSAAFSWVYWMSYVDVVESGDLIGSKLMFISNKWSSTTYDNSIL